jgi:serine/threonine protein kinase
MEQGTLSRLIDKVNSHICFKISSISQVLLAYDTILILQELLSRKLYHNDLKLANLMLCIPPGNTGFNQTGVMRVRLIDLGAMTNGNEIPAVISDFSSAPKLISNMSNQNLVPSSEFTESFTFAAFLFEFSAMAKYQAAERLLFPKQLTILHRSAIKGMSADPTARPGFSYYQQILAEQIERLVSE